MSREEDVRYMSARLLLFERWRASLTSMREVLPRLHAEIDALAARLDLEIDNLEYCLKRDRINHDKPE